MDGDNAMAGKRGREEEGRTRRKEEGFLQRCPSCVAVKVRCSPHIRAYTQTGRLYLI